MAIAAVAYLRVINSEGQCHVGFVMGKAKLAPRPAHTVPRLELCGAVLAVEMAELILREIDEDVHAVDFYTDSRIVLGYIHNTSRRFYMYVSNRVNRILKSSRPEQWHHIATESNPADHATRPVSAAALKNTNWFSGPEFLGQPEEEKPSPEAAFTLIEPDVDEEIRPEIAVFSTKAAKVQLGASRFERFSTWRSILRAMGRLIHTARAAAKTSQEHTADVLWQTKAVVIRSVQQEAYKEEIRCLEKGGKLSRQSPLKKLNPTIDEDGLLRIGGRISSADLPNYEKHPLIIPKSSHIATLLVRHYHEEVAHQGRHFTEGVIRAAGLWIVGSKHLVSRVIHKCVTCKRLRGRLMEQKMADIPADRLTTEPPFTHVGLDVFGPWSITSRRTRGGSAESKRWAVLFTCMSTRAVHIETIESMSTSSFINALRRFFAVRGPSKQLRSDRGTNFVGACKELQINTEDSELKKYLAHQGCTWIFNPPHSSHMGGSWERMIGVARRILDATLLRSGTAPLTHEVLTTLMAEVMAMMNARPLVPVSVDPEMPTLLTPAMLLTQKISPLLPPHGDFNQEDLHRNQWRQVQCLADTFWKRWRMEYLATLQKRRKWTEDKPNVQEGDVVLLRDNQAKRNEWPVGVIQKTFPSADGKIRKVEVRIFSQGTLKVFLRPISEVVLLLSKDT